MTLKQLLHFAYEYCQDNWLFKECDEISNLTATWCYQDLKEEPLENLKIEKLPFSDGSCPEEFEDHFINEEEGFNPYMGCYDWDN